MKQTAFVRVHSGTDKESSVGLVFRTPQGIAGLMNIDDVTVVHALLEECTDIAKLIGFLPQVTKLN